ncbi:MAG: OmpH family outer membrane protein [Flavobacteriales bacterium]|jgi:outer membrane protein|nr:OmpH family outer membrane protein [Flavobacteriales bacterium]|tara:strand:+ start:7947 stop:8456 length:510 start_codon:yes stop_codon:yes gene_type:complete
MKKIIYLLLILLINNTNVNAQKFTYIDTDYILNKIPEFKQAQDKLDAFSAEWQKEIETKYADIDAMYRAYQQEQVLLTEPMKNKREEAIMSKEIEAKDLQKKYFAPEGNLYMKRQELIKPIQDKIYDAVQKLASNNKYAIIFDSSSDLIMLYTDPNLDKSDEILEILGY